VFKSCFRYFPNLVCNNSRLRGVVSLLLNYLWNVTCDVFILNGAILVVIGLVWNPSWFQLATGIIWAQVQKFERFGACFCTCALYNLDGFVIASAVAHDRHGRQCHHAPPGRSIAWPPKGHLSHHSTLGIRCCRRRRCKSNGHRFVSTCRGYIQYISQPVHIKNIYYSKDMSTQPGV
jgi:hypothetical protein